MAKPHRCSATTRCLEPAGRPVSLLSSFAAPALPWAENREVLREQIASTITALLTLAGYSLTDTVVVYDRIRENLRLRPKDDLGAVMNSSINEVLSRTIVTSLTVFLVCLALFFFGGEVIHDFSFALLVGVVVGTYSSIFVASPIVYEWRKGKKIRIRTKR